MIKIHRHAYSQSIGFDGQQAVLRAYALYVLRVCSEHAVGLPHHGDEHVLG
jgi:hypothetical protein